MRDPVFGKGDCDECGAQDVPIAWMADNDYSLCFACIPAKYDEARAEAKRLREAATRALGICGDAADMQCRCTGYYRCNGCVEEVAERADDAAEVLRDALAPAVTGEQP